MKKALLFNFLLTFLMSMAFGQKTMLDSSITIPFIGISYAYEFPGNDMNDRFGQFSSLGGRFGIKLKSGAYIGFKIHYNFGVQVEEDGILDSIRTSEGGIIELGGNLTDPLFEMSGYKTFVTGGYLFPLFGPNPNSGILIEGGIGFVQHKIVIDYRDAQIPQLEEDYRKGYDRLSYGPALTQSITYVHLGKRKLINFFAGIDLTQAWTKNKRGFNFDTREFDDKTRFDTSFGLKVGWILTLYRRAPAEFYMY